ncbi:unnamed protein product [Diplocarpon coronariae]
MGEEAETLRINRTVSRPVQESGSGSVYLFESRVSPHQMSRQGPGFISLWWLDKIYLPWFYLSGVDERQPPTSSKSSGDLHEASIDVLGRQLYEALVSSPSAGAGAGAGSCRQGTPRTTRRTPRGRRVSMRPRSPCIRGSRAADEESSEVAHRGPGDQNIATPSWQRPGVPAPAPYRHPSPEKGGVRSRGSISLSHINTRGNEPPLKSPPLRPGRRTQARDEDHDTYAEIPRCHPPCLGMVVGDGLGRAEL